MNIKKLLCILVTLVMAVTAFVTVVHAEDPYPSYNYNAWSVAVPSQNGYIVKDTIDGRRIGLDRLSDPNGPLFISETEPATLTDAKDFFLSPKNEFFIVDTGNNRILHTDINFNLIGCYKTFTGSKVVVEKIDETHYRYVADVVDANEMLPWLRTFISRITRIEI